MTEGPLVPLFAQVWEGLRLLHLGHQNERLPDEVPCKYCDCREDAFDALSAIERHVQDMEKALEMCADLDGHMAYDEYSCVREAVNAARAALPAREKEEE